MAQGSKHSPPANEDWLARARDAIDDKAKPKGSLGKLEDWAVRLCGLQKTLNPSVDHAVLLLFGADHGITKDAAVSAYPREVTASVFKAIAAGKAASTVMAAALDCQVALWDVGLDADVAHVTSGAPHVQVLHYKIKEGSGSFVKGPAMEEEEVQRALAVGMLAVLAACGDTASCVHLPLPPHPSPPDAESPVPAFGWRNRNLHEGQPEGMSEEAGETLPSSRSLPSPSDETTVSSMSSDTWQVPPCDGQPCIAPGTWNEARRRCGTMRYTAAPCSSGNSASFTESAVDERSPPGVSERCIHCGMPTHPSCSPQGDSEGEAMSVYAPSPQSGSTLGGSTVGGAGGTEHGGTQGPDTQTGLSRQLPVLPLEIESDAGTPILRAGSQGNQQAPAEPAGNAGVARGDDAGSVSAAAGKSQRSWGENLPQIVGPLGREDAGPQEITRRRGTVICVGEIGIGNTTAASAILAALEGLPPKAVCGKGTGLDEVGVQRKVEAVSQGIAVNSLLLAMGPQGVLKAVGGLEIAAMTGAYLACGQLRIPALVDGFISGVAALVALRLDPTVEEVLFWSHTSAEKAAAHLLAAAGGAASPVLDMGLRLGEGTGSLLALPLLRTAAAVITNMATLSECLQL